MKEQAKRLAKLAELKKELEDGKETDRGGKGGAKKGKKDDRDRRDGKGDKKDGGKKTWGKKNDEGERDKQKDDDGDERRGAKNLNLYRGYFDKALEKMGNLPNSNNEALKFNSEFHDLHTKIEHEGLLMAGFRTTRGHVTFNFIGPGDKEVKGLSKFFTENTSTRGIDDPLAEDKM